MLLGSQDRTWSTYPNPADEISSVELEIFNAVTGDERTCPTQSGLTVYCYHALLCFCQRDEFINDFHAGAGSIHEVQVDMIDALRGETGGLVGFSVEPNHIGDSKLLEDGYVVGRSKSTVLNKGI